MSLLFTGCVEKKSILHIDNLNLCSEPVAMLYIKDVSIKNNARTFNIAPDEIRNSLINSLKETNCFGVSSYKESQFMDSDRAFILNAQVTLSQEEIVVEKTLFKKEQEERIGVAITMQAFNDTKKVNASSKSELLIEKSKVLGFKNERDVMGDSQTVLQNATKKVSVSLRDGFIKIGN